MTMILPVAVVWVLVAGYCASAAKRRVTAQGGEDSQITGRISSLVIAITDEDDVIVLDDATLGPDASPFERTSGQWSR